MTGQIDGNIIFETLPSLDTLFELDEMSDGEFSQALQAGELSELVVIRPDIELNSSSLLDESVPEDTKVALDARSGSTILKDPLDPFYPLVVEFQDVVCHNPPSVLPPDRGVRHEIDLVPGTKYCVTRQWPLTKEQCDDLTTSFVQSTRQEWYVRANLPIPHRPSVSKSPMGSGALSMLTISLIRPPSRLIHQSRGRMFFRNIW